MMTTKTTQPLTPAFQFGGPNQNVLLAKDTVAIKIDGKTYTGNGEIRLNLLPRAGIYIYTEFQNIPTAMIFEINFGKKKITSFTFGVKKVPDFSLGAGGDANKQTMTLLWRPKSEPLIGAGDATTLIQRIVFHLFNFKDIIGMLHTWEKNGPDKQAIEHVDLSDNSWTIELRSLVKTRDHFEKLRAEGGYGLTHIGCLKRSDKFRLLFSSLDIPIDISTNTPALGKLAKQFNWLDAPHAMTEVRNSLVHPVHKLRGQFGAAMFETWNLGLWYLELALLRICDYSGTYSNRLVISRWVGQIEDVPWKKNAG